MPTVNKKWFNHNYESVKNISNSIPEGKYGFVFGDIQASGKISSNPRVLVGTNEWIRVELIIYTSFNNVQNVKDKTVQIFISGAQRLVYGTTDQYIPGKNFVDLLRIFAKPDDSYKNISEFYEKYLKGNPVVGTLTWRETLSNGKTFTNARVSWDVVDSQELLKRHKQSQQSTQTPEPNEEF